MGHSKLALVSPRRAIHSVTLQCLVLAIFVALMAQHGSTQPKAIGPDDISRQQQESEFSSDWSETDVFDLDRYLTLNINIHRLDVPERVGNVYLWFSTKNPQKLTEQRDLPTDLFFKATLQSLNAVRFLEISERDFPRGAAAIVRGWPATAENITGSVLLVDEIKFTGSGKTFALHGGDATMDSKRSDHAKSD